MGSLLLARSGVFGASEQFCVTHPDLVREIHLDYIRAGADVIYTNTFGVNPLRQGAAYADLVDRALTLAEEAKAAGGRPTRIALDIGPTGHIVGKAGITFEEAYDSFAAIVQAGGERADYVVLETFTDLNELRAAILAVKEHSHLPIAASMSFEKGGRSAFGCSVRCFALTATALGVDAVGINCSLGPAEMAYFFTDLRNHTPLPTFVKPNAGMPQIHNGKSIYNVTPEGFARGLAALRRMGAQMVGGCCGTTPAYIAALREAVAHEAAPNPHYVYNGELCSALTSVKPTGSAIIGERINPTGKKILQAALRAGDIDSVVALGPKQEEEGARLLDVNLGVSGMNDATYLVEVVERLMAVTSAPLVIDSANSRTIELGLRHFAGRALVNSVNGNDATLDDILPLVRHYGAAVIGLCLDANGIPDNVEGRVRIARKILQRAREYGIPPEDVYIDCLTMSEGATSGAARLTLDTLTAVKRLGCRTVLGVSNVSYGLPLREDINAAFLRLASDRGLDAAIVNPMYRGLAPSPQALDLLMGRIEVDDYIRYAQGSDRSAPTNEPHGTLSDAVRHGDAVAVRTLVRAMLAEGKDPTPALVDALDTVGIRYEQGRFFLPQLISAAEAAKAGFDLLYAGQETVQTKGTLVLATVWGDVHDIGKNIVKAVVSNYGYRVVDLGKDVPTDAVIAAIDAHYPCCLGLSALMTTTADHMSDTVREVRRVYPTIPILVGGAVITETFAEGIGCTYCKDAAATVRALAAIYDKEN